MSISDGGLYRRFEDSFRGKPEDVKAKLRAYEPILEALETAGLARAGVDYGCGRGEWLALVAARGWSVTGVDIDTHMVQGLSESGRQIVMQDAVAHISSLPSRSQTLVSGFHIAEHLSPADLLALIGEARRVLAPGGILILETPNPENVLVGSNRFYMDPTHVRPIPPQFLNFIANDVGFTYCSVIGFPAVHAAKVDGALAQAFQSCLDVPNDYALIAQTMPEAGVAAIVRLDRLLDSSYARNDAFAATAYSRFRDRLCEQDDLNRRLSIRVEALERARSTKGDPTLEMTIRQLGEDVRSLRAELADYVDVHEFSLRLGERFDLFIERVAALEDRLKAQQDITSESRRLIESLGPYANTFDRRIVKAERRLERYKWHTMLIWPLTLPVGALARAIAKQVKKYKKRRRNRRVGA